MKSRNEQGCHDFIEAIIDEKVDMNFSDHVADCETCQQAHNLIKEFSHLDSAFAKDDHINLQKIVINRLLPIIQAPQPPQINSEGSKAAAGSWLSWLIGLSLAGAFLFALVSSSQPSTRPNQQAPRLPIVASADSQTFLIAVNNKESITVSMDNPVSLFNNETAVVKLADQSEIVLVGPSRMTVKPRGFHLLNGKATATVKPGEKPFIATTMHGSIEVIGTIFTCETSLASSKISVAQGKIKVVDNGGHETFLKAGESTTLSAENASQKQTEGIPKISEE